MFISLINNIFSFLLRLLNNNCKDIFLNLTLRNAHMIMLRYMMERQQKRRHWDFSVAIGSHIPQSHRRTRCTLSLNRMARFREAGSQQTIPPVSRNPLLAYKLHSFNQYKQLHRPTTHEYTNARKMCQIILRGKVQNKKFIGNGLSQAKF